MTGDLPGPETLLANADTTASAVEPSRVRPPRVGKPDPDRRRLCIVTRQELPPSDLIRFVAGPDATIFPDLSRRLPGRGVWVTATRSALSEAVKRGLFAKSLKQPIKVDKALPDQVETLLAAEARQALSLANKAGLVTTGFSKVESAIEKGQVTALLAANDASKDGAGKLIRKFKAIRGASHLPAPVVQDFSTAELNLATGGSNVVHAALARGGLGQRVLICCQRLRHFRMQADDAECLAPDIGAASVPALAPSPEIADTATAEATTASSAAVDSPGRTLRHAMQAGTAGARETKSDQAGTDHE